MSYQDDWDRDDYGQDEDQLDDQDSLEGSDLIDDPSQDIKNEEGPSHSVDSDDEDSDREELMKDTEECIQILDDENPFPLANKVRVTNPYMSKYEKAAIIGKRAQQIADGSPIYIQINWQFQNLPTPLEVAEQELKLKRTPFIVRRHLPNGEFEDWKITDLKQRL